MLQQSDKCYSNIWGRTSGPGCVVKFVGATKQLINLFWNTLAPVASLTSLTLPPVSLKIAACCHASSLSSISLREAELWLTPSLPSPLTLASFPMCLFNKLLVPSFRSQWSHLNLVSRQIIFTCLYSYYTFDNLLSHSAHYYGHGSHVDFCKESKIYFTCDRCPK